MNIIEAYIKFNSQLIILISGLSISKKTRISKQTAELFKIRYINLNNYYKSREDISDRFELPDKTNIINYYTDNSINWDKFNKDINDIKYQGVIISGLTFPSDKIKFKVDCHISLTQNKQDYIKQREDFITKYKNKYIEEYKLLTNNLDKYIVNNLIYTYITNSKKDNNINKTIYTSDLNFDDVYDQVFNSLIKFIEVSLKQ
jgi:hypothetical protein